MNSKIGSARNEIPENLLFNFRKAFTVIIAFNIVKTNLIYFSLKEVSNNLDLII